MNQAIITILTIGIPVIGTGYAVYKSSKVEVLKTQVDNFKTEALSKAEVIKNATTVETKRLNDLLDGQGKFIDNLQEQSLLQDGKIEKLRDKLDVCLDSKVKESTDFQQQITDLKITIKELEHMVGSNTKTIEKVVEPKNKGIK